MIEELILYLDQEVRFPLRVKYNRAVNRFNRFKQQHPNIMIILYCLILLFMMYIIYYQ